MKFVAELAYILCFWTSLWDPVGLLHLLHIVKNMLDFHWTYLICIQASLKSLLKKLLQSYLKISNHYTEYQFLSVNEFKSTEIEISWV
jgi:hypothetical protein